ncbi:alpha-mannosidase [Fictibacillus terranigra]|uniref:Glycoside hydrolase family 38 C-terminal domain-containing protein n=1 Tax=Fictibacillus terranigra TaxID=3058424 RepID=A0ABT8EBR6_9BACL|nr:glycoside hydrolase family 38 C-terminal domain-containing protein [Fictibacillus sp. CENA-BCM004]MDN4075312.1 glycoside hydrolase family 38 C-terminal domain-containing protein [Fictibacillus sp. CENA-BCM004]
MLFTIEKIEAYLQEIKGHIYRRVQDIPSFKFKEWEFGEEVKEGGQPGFDDQDWSDFHVGEYWGGYDKSAWFRTTISIPKEWKNERVVLHFLVGPRDGGGSTAETLLYINGTPLQGIDVWHEEAWLPPEVLKEQNIHIALKAWSGVLKPPERRRFKTARVACVDTATEKFFYLADTSLNTVKILNETDLRRTKLLQVLNKSILMIDFLKPGSDYYYQTIEKAYQFLKVEVDQLAEHEEIKAKVKVLGHSHIDMAWLWRLTHTREKASRTFSTVLHLMRQYPEYRYIHTSPQLYKFLKEDYPEIFVKVKEKIAAGEWEITGGMWVEPDTNMPSGESLIRQIQFGKRFMKQEFGVDSKVVWLPDVFGYSWSLPQIIKKSGIETFMTTKISWSQYNRFPYDTFHWRGVDGTEIFTHFITTPEDSSWFYTYNGMIKPSSIKGTWDAYKQKEINDELLLAFGWGDGGGGPTKEMIESARVMKNLPGLPKVEMEKAEPYFENLQERVKNQTLPVWDGELYLEYHRGTYTSQAALKRANRKAEYTYHNAEWLSVLSDLFTGKPQYPHDGLNAGWELMLLNQFHDILPGSSIRQVNEDARRDYDEIQAISEKAVNEAKETLEQRLQAKEDGIVVYNPLSLRRNGFLELPVTALTKEAAALIDEAGNITPIQTIIDGEVPKVLAEAENIPALGYKTFTVSYAEQDHQSDMIVYKNYIENDYYQIRLNEKGQITSLFDKRLEREVLAKGSRGNVFQTFEDKPMRFDAWDIDLYYQEKMREIDDLEAIEILETGPIRATLKLSWRFYDSTITQLLTVYKNSPRIDFRTNVNWQEKQTLLKVAFPVNVRSTRATYDIQFGCIERPTHWNTSWDQARFEVVGHKWADLSEGNFGVSLLNDCKYGYDVKDHIMRLTLIKSSIEPDETADRGIHVFTYSLLPHQGDWREGNTVQEAYNLNVPLLSSEVSANPSGNLPAAYEFASIDCNNVILETVKKAEEGEAVIVRFYEYKQFRNPANVTFALPIKKAAECSLIEEGEEQAIYNGRTLSFAMEPFEIKTFKIWF